MRILRTIRNYFFYCGIEKDEYNAIKKEAYVSNFEVWKILHFLMAVLFAALFISSLFTDLMRVNGPAYLAGFGYSLLIIGLFFMMKKDSIIPQFLIYLTISLLFIFGIVLSVRNPDVPAVSFIAFLLITPMFMIDKPFFMAFELSAASAVFLIWTYPVKPYDVWIVDLANIIPFTIIGIFLNVIANSLRIKEFVLTRMLNIQKDTDDLTGLKNKGAIIREIDKFLSDDHTRKGIMYVMDIDHFKVINDTCGHDVGDEVIAQFGRFLDELFAGDEIVGRFGGDEFIVFIRDTDDRDIACRIAEDIVKGCAGKVVYGDGSDKVSASIGIAIYQGEEKDYSELFKRADSALYEAKADAVIRYHISEG
ncbi:MAG: putative diguanylate cyclase AdrA [Firmicutes bacterium ADurb.Bin354]|nr:MAG: putative diguanylate cyclase AdrA [Firmicutes bacterium ADurb.Bin354]